MNITGVDTDEITKVWVWRSVLSCVVFCYGSARGGALLCAFVLAVHTYVRGA